jgi:biogenesis AIM24-like protein/zinc ribbon protein
MNCPKCGAQMNPGSTFCGVCGNRLDTAAAGSMAGGEGIHIDEDSRGQGRGYSYEVLHQPAFSLAVVNLQAEQSIQAESGAMVSMSANIELQSQMKGGLFGAIKRAAGGESAFVSTFTARGGPGEVTLAPGAPGDIAAIEMNNQTFFVQSSSYLAGDSSLVVDTKWGGAKSFFGVRDYSCCKCRELDCCSCRRSARFIASDCNPVNVTSWILDTSSRGKVRRNTLCARLRRDSSAAW